MDDYSIKVLSWIGILLVTTYRRLWIKSSEMIREEEDLPNNSCNRNEALPESSRENIKLLTESITNDTNYLLKWIRNDQTLAKWKKGDTKTLSESQKIQMVSWITESCTVRYRIIVLLKPTADKATLIQWVRENEKHFTLCSHEDKKAVAEWIKDNRQMLAESIEKDTKTFISMIGGEYETFDEKTEQDINIIIEMNRLSSSNTYRHYTIVLSKTTCNKETMTEIRRQDKGARALFEPGRPSALNITSTTVELTWDEPSVGAHFVHFYKLICEEKSIGATSFFKTPANSCKYVVKGLKSNTEYEFKIQPIKNGGKQGPISKTFKVST